MKTGIIVFAFGKPSWTKANLCLAAEALNVAYAKGIVNVFCQKDIDIPVDENIITIVRVVREVDNYDTPTTLAIAQSAFLWAQANALEKVIIVAARPHKWRCLRDVTRVFGDQIEVENYNKTDSLTNSVWFNKNSRQLYTRRPVYWWARELFIRTLPYTLYSDFCRMFAR